MRKFRLLQTFRATAAGRGLTRTAADQMIDFLVTQNPGLQAGASGFLGTLLTRLSDVLSKPE